MATAVAMGASALQVAVHWLRFKRFEKIQVITLVLIVVLGSATLLLHESIFIKWKPSVIYALFAVILFGSQWLSEKPALERMLCDKIQLPRVAWCRLNVSWAVFFSVMAALNIYVAYAFSTTVWVYFKVIGVLGLTLLFIVAQAAYMARHLEKPPAEN